LTGKFFAVIFQHVGSTNLSFGWYNEEARYRKNKRLAIFRKWNQFTGEVRMI